MNAVVLFGNGEVVVLSVSCRCCSVALGVADEEEAGDAVRPATKRGTQRPIKIIAPVNATSETAMSFDGYTGV